MLPDRDFERLLVSSQAKLYAYCRKLTRHTQRAEDLQQDASARAWEKRSLYKSDDNFLSWLKTVARNLYINQVKKENLMPMKTIPQFLDNNDDSLEDWLMSKRSANGNLRHGGIVPSIAPNQEDYYLENRIMEVIATLPPHQALLVNKKLEGLTYQEIAKPLGIKANNAKQRYFNVIKELREKLQQQGLLDE